MVEMQTWMGTLESSIGAGVDSWIDQAMEYWRVESHEQNTLLREQMMEQMQQIAQMFANQHPVRLYPIFLLGK